MSAAHPSLKAHLALWLGGGIGLLAATATAMTFLAVRKEINESFDAALVATAQRLLPLALVQIYDHEDDGTDQIVAEIGAEPASLAYVVRNRDGRVLIRSRFADPAAFPPYVRDGFVNTDSLRIYSVAGMRGAVSISVAEPLSLRAKEVREAIRPMLAPSLAAFPLAILLIVFVVEREFRAVRRVTGAIAERGGANLDPVPLDGVPEELLPMARAVNHLLQRIAEAMEAERRFASNAAHELRTPVAAALAQVQRLAAETAEPATARRARAVGEALARLAALTEKLLQLARAEGAAALGDTVQDVRPVLRLVAEDVARDPDRRARLVLRLPDSPVMSRITPDALAILLRNLVENAFVHGSETGAVEVVLDEAGRLSVANDCAPLPPEELRGLTRPLVRRASGPGTGLGLAIAARIAQAAGAELELNSPRPGAERGFQAALTLP